MSKIILLILLSVKLISSFKLSDFDYLLTKLNITKVVYIYDNAAYDQEFLNDLSSLNTNNSNYYISMFSFNRYQKNSLSEDLRLGRNHANYDWNTNYCKIINEDYLQNDYVIFFFDYLELLIQVIQV
jgi:hypothetical protein